MQTQYKFSVYHAPIKKKNATPIKTITLEDVHRVVISKKYEALTNELRQINGKDKQNEFKASKLDYVTFSGIFTERATTGLLQHSNLLCIDLDNLNNVVETKNSIIEILPPSLMFVSPTGNGIKLVYKVNITKAEHIDYFKAFEQFFKQQMSITIDDKCKDIARACFLCYDKEAYYNNEAEIIDKSFIDTFYTVAEKVQQIEYKALNTQAINDYSIIMERVKTWLNKKESYVNGNRHGYLTKLAGAYNRYGVPQNLAENDVVSFCQSDCKPTDLLNIVKGIYKRTDWHNTAKFEINAPYDFTVDEVDVKPEVKEPTPLLPINGFPEYLQGFINEYVSVYNVPHDYIAASVLFSTALAIGNKLELKGKYENIPLLWLAIVGNVSSGKTEPLKTCLSYFTNKDKEAFNEYQIQKSLFEAEKEKPKKERDTTIQPPQYFQYLLNDYTPEALYNVHTVNNRGLCIYRDELKGWLDDFGRYNKSGEQSTMISTFYRETLQINRASKEPIFIYKPCIYVSGGIQPDILHDLAKDNRAENGFLSRLIFAYPDLADKQPYSNKKLNTDTLLNYQKYLSVLANLTEIVDLKLSDEAENVYCDWFNDNVKKTNDEPTGYLKGVYGKLDVISLRLAIVVHGMDFVCNQNTSTVISATNMQTAIELTEYFRATALKVYDKIFKDTGNSNLNKKDVAKYCHSLGASQNEIAASLKVSQQYVQKILK
ncbi:MAG: DUF3987 domain-containing protein [Flavobacteriales bacterium]|nr:DUF3987 domain-containing protein [Flavobacteriales bacterium]